MEKTTGPEKSLCESGIHLYLPHQEERFFYCQRCCHIVSFPEKKPDRVEPLRLGTRFPTHISEGPKKPLSEEEMFEKEMDGFIQDCQKFVREDFSCYVGKPRLSRILKKPELMRERLRTINQCFSQSPTNDKLIYVWYRKVPANLQDDAFEEEMDRFIVLCMHDKTITDLDMDEKYPIILKRRDLIKERLESIGLCYISHEWLPNHFTIYVNLGPSTTTTTTTSSNEEENEKKKFEEEMKELIGRCHRNLLDASFSYIVNPSIYPTLCKKPELMREPLLSVNMHYTILQSNPHKISISYMKKNVKDVAIEREKQMNLFVSYCRETMPTQPWLIMNMKKFPLLQIEDIKVRLREHKLLCYAIEDSDNLCIIVPCFIKEKSI